MNIKLKLFSFSILILLGNLSFAVDTDGNVDIDGNEQFDALTDGLLILRSMFGLTGTSLISGTVASDAVYTDADDIQVRITALGNRLDIDNNGTVDALSDGLIILRYLFGLTGDTLTNGVVATDAERITATDIESHIEMLTSFDLAPPVLSYPSIIPSIIHINTAPTLIAFTIDVSDDSVVSPIDNPILRNQAGDTIQSSNGWVLVSGNNRNGTWSAEIEAGVGIAPGPYYWSAGGFQDFAGNIAQYESPGSGGDEMNGLTILSESNPPVLTDFSVTPSSVDVSGEDQVVTISYRGTDESGIVDGSRGWNGRYIGSNFVRAYTKSIYGLDQLVSLADGTPRDGTWVAHITIPRDYAPGEAQVSTISVYDIGGNRSSGFSLGSFNILNSNGESNAPELSNIEVTPVLANVASESASIKITYRGTDESGIVDGNDGWNGNYVGFNFGRFNCNNTSANYQDRRFNLISGDVFDGVWEASFNIDEGSPAGDCYISIVNVPDRQGITASGSFSPITIINDDSETDPPAISNINLSSYEIDVSDQEKTLKVSYRGQDATGIVDGNLGWEGNYLGQNFVRLSPKNGGGTDNIDTLFSLETGSYRDGIWLASVTIPQGYRADSYGVTFVNIRDRNGAAAVIGDAIDDVVITND